jgi:hypothetical protein
VLIAPWEVEVDAPAAVAAGEDLRAHGQRDLPVHGAVRDGRVAGLPGGSAGRRAGAARRLERGRRDRGATRRALAGATATWTFRVTAGAELGVFSLGAEGSGLVSGSLAERAQFPAYDYTDLIGGSATAAVEVVGD